MTADPAATPSPVPPLEAPTHRRDIDANVRQYLLLNQKRLERAKADLTETQRSFLTLLPLLFQDNHAGLPGYISDDIPAGIPDYSPGRDELAAARRFSNTFTLRRRAFLRYFIRGIYLMGSMGTVGYTQASDCDIWLCHDAGINGTDLMKLQAKARQIEAKSRDLRLDMNIFVMSAENFREGRLDSLSHESSGTAQHIFLLEEFYRTGLLLAGRPPLWWVVPPSQEKHYRDFVQGLREQDLIEDEEFLDFGGLAEMPAEELYGATVWTLFKGIETPYKAILKIMLMESYLEDYPNPNWLAVQAKSAIYNGETDLTALDAYLLLYRQVERYLTRRNQSDRLELARRAFYIKTGERLSEQRTHSWRNEIIQGLIREWGWGQSERFLLDSRSSWKIERVLESRQGLVGELSRSYRTLTEFARTQTQADRIDPGDLNLLGRTLYVAWERRAGKVERINPGISSNLTEPQLTFYHASLKNGQRSWLLFKDKIDINDPKRPRPLKSSLSLIEHLVWLEVNRITRWDTAYFLLPSGCPVTIGELRKLIEAIREMFAKDKVFDTHAKDLKKTAHPRLFALFLNVGVDPSDPLVREGRFVTSDRYDPLSFGAFHTNLVVQIERVIVSSWGELEVHRSEGADGLMDALASFLTMVCQTPTQVTPPRILSHCFSGSRAALIAKRVEGLCQEVTAIYRRHTNSRFLVEIGNAYYLLSAKNHQVGWTRLETRETLYQELGEPLTRHSPLTLDGNTLAETPLQTVFHTAREGEISLFYLAGNQTTEVFVVDETGALFRHTLATADLKHALVHLQRFITSMRLLRSYWDVSGGVRTLFAVEPIFYSLKRQSDASWQPERVDISKANGDYLELKLVTENEDLLDNQCTLICDGREFSCLAYGDELFSAVASHIRRLRRHQEPYPIYITAVELAQTPTGTPPPGIELLRIKTRMERRLNQALEALDQTPFTTVPVN
ncbi:adenylate cyclase, class 1 [Gammaproteobacteria bacterium]